MRICSLGNVNMQTVFPALVPVFSCIRMISRVNLAGRGIEDYPLFICLVMLLGEIAGGALNFVFVVQEIKDDTEKKKSLAKVPHPTVSFQYITKPTDFKFLQNYLILFGLAAIESISTIVYFGISTNYEDLLNIEFNMKSIQILFTVLFCSFVVLHYPVYMHQSVAIVLIIIGIVLITIMPSIEKANAWKVILFWICYFFLWSIKDVVDKLMMEVRFLKPLFIIFVEGLMGMGITLLFSIICALSGTNRIFGVHTSVAVWNVPYDSTAFGVTVGYFIGNLGLYICLILTNKFYTPNTKAVADSISNVLWWLISLIFLGGWKDQTTTTMTMNIIGYALICFGCILFNEVVIFYFCGLHENTKSEIMRRGTEDYVPDFIALGEINETIE